MKLHFTGNLSTVSDGLQILAPDYGFELCDDGMTVTAEKGDGVYVSCNGSEAKIIYDRECEFFRALGHLIQNLSKGNNVFEIKETRYFDTCGGMTDLSHGALLTVDAIKSCLRKMAMMGLNMFFLYREESYYIPEYEYFGYMRGRHTDEQIKEIDDYAAKLGIEIIPAIQCLGHLSNTLCWRQFADIKDTYDCLLVGEEKTYEFIECMIKAAMKPLRTKRVHIGFDETMSLGTGAYRAKHGHVPREDIFNEHLQRVAEICKRLGYEPNIWADMFFRIGGGAEGYAITNRDIPEEVAKQIPENIELTSWNYSAVDDKNLSHEIKALQSTGRKVWFAGAVHDWHGFCVNYYLTEASSRVSLNLCKKLGVDSLIDTTWGDDSPERDFFCNLLGFQIYAEHMYRNDPDFDEVKKRFDFCAKVPAQLIIDIADIDNAEGVKDVITERANETDILDTPPSLVNPSKYLMWQDPIAGLFDTEAEKLDFYVHFATQRRKLEKYVGKYPEYEATIQFYISLCDMLCLKCDFGVRLRKFYLEDDRIAMECMADAEIPEMIKRLEDMWLKNRTLWFERHQAFGFDVLERRYGALTMRLKTTAYRIHEYLSGNIDSIEELDEPRLPHNKPSKHITYQNGHLQISTAWGR